jgi:hypothetical protein
VKKGTHSTQQPENSTNWMVFLIFHSFVCRAHLGAVDLVNFLPCALSFFSSSSSSSSSSSFFFFHFLKCFDYSIEIPLREENCTDGLGD